MLYTVQHLRYDRAMEKTAQSRLMDAIIAWMAELESYPGWREWQTRKMGILLLSAHGQEIQENLPDFEFTEDIDQGHDAVSSYLSLATSLQALKECEYYFRRYPFHGLPVSKDAHLRNICEMYFNRFYEFRERLKRCLNAVNKTLERGKLDTGRLLRSFSKAFDEELRSRNAIHHHDRFEDPAIQGIGIAGIIAGKGDAAMLWEMTFRQGYRKASAEWANRVRKQSVRVEIFVEAVAEAMLTHCPYLSGAQKEEVKAAPEGVP